MDLNLAVVCGRCSSGVELRTLASGQRLGALALRTSAAVGARRGQRPGATSVPVTVWDPPAWLGLVEPGEPLVVVGVLRRRFFATRDGRRGSRVGIEATMVGRATPAQLGRAWRRACGALDALVGPAR